MDGRKEIQPCVLQDIGPLGPLPKKHTNRNIEQQGLLLFQNLFNHDAVEFDYYKVNSCLIVKKNF